MNTETRLAESGVFKGADGLRQMADNHDFWDQQPYGKRFYFGNGITDYLHRDVLCKVVELLDSASSSKTKDSSTPMDRKAIRMLLKDHNATEHPYDSDQFTISIQDIEQLIESVKR